MGKKKDKYVIFQDSYDDEITETLQPSEQVLRIRMEKKGRNGKAVTIVVGFEGLIEDEKELAKTIKQHCGVGGTVNQEGIVIQGDQKKKIIPFLINKGYKNTK